MDFIKNLSTSQIWAQVRQYVTYAAGAATAFGVITLTQKTVVIDNVDQVLTSLQAITASLATITGAIVLIINAFKSNKAASPETAVQRVQEIATNPQAPHTAEAKTALVEATNSIPEVRGVVMDKTVAGRALAESIPAPTVVPAGTPEAVAIARGEPVQ